MAKRKRTPGSHKGFRLELVKDYRSERYVMYIAHAETGILQAGTINPDLTDGDVFRALADLIAQLQEPDTFARLFPVEMAEKSDVADKNEGQSFVQIFILMNLRDTFKKYGRLEAVDVIGILDVIKTSVKRWGVGMHRRGYLTYIEGFLGQAGVKVQQISQEEVEALGLTKVSDRLEEGD